MQMGDLQILLFHLEEDLPPDHLHRATCSKGRTHCRLVLLYHFVSITLWSLCYNLSIECPVFVGYSEIKIYVLLEFLHIQYKKQRYIIAYCLEIRHYSCKHLPFHINPAIFFNDFQKYQIDNEKQLVTNKHLLSCKETISADATLDKDP